MTRLPFLMALLPALLAPAAPAATISLVGGATQGHYNDSLGDLGAPTGTLPWFPAPGTFTGTQDLLFDGAPDLAGAATALGDWLGNPAGLNANWSGPQAIPAGWAVNTEVAIIYAVDAGPGLADITASFGHVDNGIHVWVDGVWRFGARDPEGRAWNGIALGGVGAGTHYIQILLEDSGGVTGYLNPDISGTEIPVPAGGWLALTCVGAACAAGKRRRARRAASA